MEYIEPSAGIDRETYNTPTSWASWNAPAGYRECICSVSGVYVQYRLNVGCMKNESKCRTHEILGHRIILGRKFNSRLVWHSKFQL